jgi:hypothetical protein
VDQLFLTALARHATPEELTAVSRDIAGDPKSARASVFQDVLWTLLNSKEFIYNH